ncbi:hypothetical protein R6Q59_011000 [Mikania micrantha]
MAWVKRRALDNGYVVVTGRVDRLEDLISWQVHIELSHAHAQGVQLSAVPRPRDYRPSPPPPPHDAKRVLGPNNPRAATTDCYQPPETFKAGRWRVPNRGTATPSRRKLTLRKPHSSPRTFFAPGRTGAAVAGGALWSPEPEGREARGAIKGWSSEDAAVVAVGFFGFFFVGMFDNQKAPPLATATTSYSHPHHPSPSANTSHHHPLPPENASHHHPPPTLLPAATTTTHRKRRYPLPPSPTTIRRHRCPPTLISTTH